MAPEFDATAGEDEMLFGAVEAGGTKFLCAIGDGFGRIETRAAFPTTSPEETISNVIAFFRRGRTMHGALAGIGVGSFGPVDVDPSSPLCGRIGRTPKAGWKNANIAKALRQALDLPVAVDTDVNCALIAEHERGAGRGADHLAYVTVGTGVGAGLMIGGKIIRGLSHPEAGHMVIPKLAEDAAFQGVCPFHGDRCVEGLASGPAMKARSGAAAETLPDDHPAWEIEARYLAALCANLFLCVAPQHIILGGGVMQRDGLVDRVRAAFLETLNGYVDFSAMTFSAEALIRPAALGTDAGIIGGLALIRNRMFGS